MFYQVPPEKALRFGDIVQGYVLASPDIVDPIKNAEFTIDINTCDLCVVLTPCCSIKDQVINLVPLKKVPKDHYKTPYLAVDMTRINKIMTQFEAMKVSRVELLTAEELKEAKESIKTYHWKNEFVYEGNEYFKEYNVDLPDGTSKPVNYYMINFKDIHKIKCKFIQSPEIFPAGSRLMQLSVDTRRDLMDKLYAYYRIPDEDMER